MNIISGEARQSPEASNKRARNQRKRDKRRSRRCTTVEDNIGRIGHFYQTDKTVASLLDNPDKVGSVTALNPDQFGIGECLLDQGTIQKRTLQDGNGGDYEIRGEIPQDLDGIHGSDTLGPHHIQPLQIEPFGATGQTDLDDEHVLNGDQTYANEEQHGDNRPTSPWILELGLGDIDYQDTLGPTFECYSSPEDIGDYNSIMGHDTCMDQLSTLSGYWTPDYLMSDSRSQQSSPFPPQHQLTTNEAHADVFYSMDDLNEVPLPLHEPPVGEEPEQHGQHNMKNFLNQEFSGNQPGQEMLFTHHPGDCLSGSHSDKDDHQSVVDIQPSSDEGNATRKLLACPWYKKNPWKYQDCAKFKLLRIKDVKQHAYRKHMKPKNYCPVCFEVFQETSDRDGHIQKQKCTARAAPIFDGISEQQRKKLNRKVNRGRNDEEHWYNVWDTIFPGECRPRSPYLGSGGEELLSLLRNCWNKRWPEILSAVSQKQLDKFEPKIIQRIVNSIFDRLEEESLSLGSIPDERSDSTLEEAPNILELSTENIGGSVEEGVRPPQ
ncbi:hypothetical protein F5Y04DRAFT_280410 [Hypomontagnella monticulosa]|nr:hypothetical protein F5Y04DRAFT_280410 [Hypomontagnella monticulosa]